MGLDEALRFLDNSNSYGIENHVYNRKLLLPGMTWNGSLSGAVVLKVGPLDYSSITWVVSAVRNANSQAPPTHTD